MVTKKQAFGKSLFVLILSLPLISACRTFSKTDANSSQVSMKVPTAFACSTALLLSSIQHKINSPDPAKVIVSPIIDREKQEAEFIKELKTLNNHKDSSVHPHFLDYNTLCRLREFKSNSTLTDLELIATFLYTRGGHRPINQELRGKECSQLGLMTGLIVDGVMRLPMKAADPAFFRVEVLKGSSPESFREALGATYSPPSFFSTSTDASVVPRFLLNGMTSDHYVFWNIKKAQGPYLGKSSAYKDEKEVLFPPGSRFKVEKVETTDSHREFGFTKSSRLEITKVELTPLDAAFRISGDE